MKITRYLPAEKELEKEIKREFKSIENGFSKIKENIFVTEDV